MKMVSMIMAITILLSLMIHSTFSIPCKYKTFYNKKTTFANCNDLPTLNSILHWTYHPSNSSLSMAFTARVPTPTGWVSWALNPNDNGMVGAQSLIAFKPSPTGPISVDTYNVQSYSEIVKGPISYNVSNLSAEEHSDGHVTIFATWAIPSDQDILNQVWQVGQAQDGRPKTHDFDKPNLESKMKLKIASGPTGAPVRAVNQALAPASGASHGAGKGMVVISVKSIIGVVLLVNYMVVSLF